MTAEVIPYPGSYQEEVARRLAEERRPHAIADTGYVFTFSFEHPLCKRYILLGGDAESTRRLMQKIFGGRYARQLTLADGLASARRHGRTRLILGLPEEEGFPDAP